MVWLVKEVIWVVVFGELRNIVVNWVIRLYMCLWNKLIYCCRYWIGLVLFCFMYVSWVLKLWYWLEMKIRVSLFLLRVWRCCRKVIVFIKGGNLIGFFRSESNWVNMSCRIFLIFLIIFCIRMIFLYFWLIVFEWFRSFIVFW